MALTLCGCSSDSWTGHPPAPWPTNASLMPPKPVVITNQTQVQKSVAYDALAPVSYQPLAAAMVIPQTPQFIIHWDNQNGIGMLIESTKDLTDDSWELRQWCGLGVTNASFPRTNSQEFFRAVSIPTDN